MSSRAPVSIAHVMSELDRHDLLPAIVFRSSRSQCDLDAERAAANPRLHLSPPVQRQIRVKVHELIEAYDMDAELILSHPQYKALVTTGVGAHHAGQLLMWRLMLEELMAAGLLRTLVATGTVAAGVDFPARSVVITAHSKRGAEGFHPLSSAEFQQMSGRAGRRGKDTVGFCLAAPSAFCDARVLLKIANQPPEPLVSQYFPSPSTVLNLLRYRTVDGLQYTVERSLAAYIDRRDAAKIELQLSQERESLSPALVSKLDGDDETALSKAEKKIHKRIRRITRQAQELSRRQAALLESALTGLRALGYLEGDNLSEKGLWASNLCTNLVIELAEIIEAGIFAEGGVERLIAVIASISGDEHRQYLTTKQYPLEKDLIESLRKILHEVRSYRMPGVVEDRAVVPPAAYTVLVWLHSASWHEFRSLLAISAVAEGDAARLITQTAEHLNQLTRLNQSHPQLALLAEEGKRRILRPPLTEVINFEGL